MVPGIVKLWGTPAYARGATDSVGAHQDVRTLKLAGEVLGLEGKRGEGDLVATARRRSRR